MEYTNPPANVDSAPVNPEPVREHERQPPPTPNENPAAESHAEGTSEQTAPPVEPNAGFSMIKNILSKLPMTKSLAVVFDFFESCGITMKQLQNLASGKASVAELDKTITPIVYRTVPALDSALEYLEEQHATGAHGEALPGDAFLLIRRVKSASGAVQPYVFICTSDENDQPVVHEHFPYFKSPSFILNAMEKNKQTKQLAAHADHDGPANHG